MSNQTISPLSSNTLPRSSSLPSILILACYAVLTVILTYPLIFNLSTAVPNDIGDPLLNTWILAWDAHALLTDPLNLFQANIFYPLPNTLAYSEHLFSIALLALPVQLITGEPIVAYNLSLLATFPLAAFGMYLFTLRWTHRRSAAFIGGFIFGFAPYRFAAIAHLQLLTFQWLPFALLFLDLLLRQRSSKQLSAPHDARHRSDGGENGGTTACTQYRTRPPAYGVFLAVTSNRREAAIKLNTDNKFLITDLWSPIPNRWLIALGLFLTLQILASWYLAVYTALIVGVYYVTAFLARRSPESLFIKSFFVVLGILLLTLPFIWPYLALIDNLQQARPLSMALSLTATSTDFIAAAPFNSFFGPLTASLRTRLGFTEEQTLFIGGVAPLLALIPIFFWLVSYIAYKTEGNYFSCFYNLRTRHLIPITSLIILVIAITLTFPVPYVVLAYFIPLSAVIRVPARWIIPALFALADLAAIGYALIHEQLLIINKQRFTSVSRLSRNYNTIFFVICTTFLLLETLSIPIPLAPVENRTALNPAYHWLAQQSANFTLIELPLHSAPAPEFPEVKRLYASTLGWWPLINGYSGYTPPRQLSLAQNVAAFPYEQSIPALQTFTKDIQSPRPELVLDNTEISKIQNPKSMYLLIHPSELPLDRTQWEITNRWHTERNPNLLPIGQFQGDYLYQILPPSPNRFSASPLAIFGQEQNISLLAVNTKHPDSSATLPAPYITLFWQSTTPISIDYTVFIHLRAVDGFVLGQADGPPVSGHHLITVWRPAEVIQDIHPWPNINLSQIDHLAIGLYDAHTGQRLAAFDPNGKPLADNAVIISQP